MRDWLPRKVYLAEKRLWREREAEARAKSPDIK